MQAIQTKYIPATNTKGSRIKAWCNAGQLTMGYPHEFNEFGAHEHVAKQLQIKLGWVGKYYGRLYGGGLPGEKGYCFVMVSAPFVLYDVLADLEHYASTHGSGPDKRLEALKNYWSI